MPLYNAQPKPRALFINFTESEDELQSSGILNLFPTYKIIDEQELGTVRQGEFEVAVVAEADAISLEEHLYVVSLGGIELPAYKSESGNMITVKRFDQSVATEFIIQDALPPAIKQLAEGTLLPIFTDRNPNPALVAYRVMSSGYSRHHSYMTNVWQPIVSDSDGKVLAGYFNRVAGRLPELWYLPPQVEGKVLLQWLDILLHRWATSEPEKFPNISDWKTEPKWQTRKEREVAVKINSEEASFAELIKKHRAAMANLGVEAELERKNADAGYRVILEAQGDELKTHVAAILQEFGFTVTDQDQVNQKGDQLEDLRAQAAVNGQSWVALVEVRGYKNGAQQNDLLRLGRFVSRYQQDNAGAMPNGVWYIVNHSMQESPTKRQLALSGSAKEVKTFAETYNGLVIDTTVLFQLRAALEDGKLTAEQIRKLLTEHTGYLKAADLKPPQA